MISYEVWAAQSHNRQDHIGELLRKYRRCDPLDPRAYRRANYTKRYCVWWRGWLHASYRQEVFGEPWKPEI